LRMRGRRRYGAKLEYCPESLVKHINNTMKELGKKNPTRIEAMEKIAEELDRIIIKKGRIKHE